jgi:hypothetical protein
VQANEILQVVISIETDGIVLIHCLKSGKFLYKLTVSLLDNNTLEQLRIQDDGYFCILQGPSNYFTVYFLGSKTPVRRINASRYQVHAFCFLECTKIVLFAY